MAARLVLCSIGLSWSSAADAETLITAFADSGLQTGLSPYGNSFTIASVRDILHSALVSFRDLRARDGRLDRPLETVNFALKDSGNIFTVGIGLHADSYAELTITRLFPFEVSDLSLEKKLLTLCGHIIFEHALPYYICIDEPGFSLPGYWDWKQGIIPIYWTNFYGVRCLRDKADIFVSAPEGTTKSLGYGGLYYEITPTFEDYERLDQSQLLGYFKNSIEVGKTSLGQRSAV